MLRQNKLERFIEKLLTEWFEIKDKLGVYP